MAAPVVAIVGATGYVGKLVVPWLLDAVEEGRIKEVRVLSRRPAQVKGAKTYVVNYDDETSLDEALSGANVLLSTSPQVLRFPPFYHLLPSLEWIVLTGI